MSRLTYYHANGKGTGSALAIELHPAHDEVAGHFTAILAPQKTPPEASLPTFDWDNAVVVKLGVSDICEMLQVLRGYAESIEDGRGLFHRTREASIVIRFSHVIEPRPGYMLEIGKTTDGETRTLRIMLSPSEALALSLAIETSVSRIVFGD